MPDTDGNSQDVQEPGYRLAARGREAAEDERLDLLEQIFDPGSRRLRAIVEPGWRCLEVGAGRGSMAVWMAEQVGPGGQVVATDIDVTYLARLQVPNLEVRRHDILDDPLDALGPGSFDLVCSRLTLFWLAAAAWLVAARSAKGRGIAPVCRLASRTSVSAGRRDPRS